LTPLPSKDEIQAITVRATEATTSEELLSVLEDLLSTCSEIVAAILAERAAAARNHQQFPGVSCELPPQRHD